MMQANPSAVPIPSFDVRAASFNSSQDGNTQMMYGASQQSVMSSYRSFPEPNGNSHFQQGGSTPQIYTVRIGIFYPIACASYSNHLL
jgi:hypothetical protein